jgi:hypothetical protein
MGVFAVGLLLALAVGLSQAQGPEPDQGGLTGTLRAQEAAAVSDYIPIQGRLTNAAGDPLNGSYSMSFRLYDSDSAATPLCEDANTVTVEDGLFSSYMKGTGCDIKGQQLYLGIQVGSDEEMEPRQYVDNVPYAWSLRPGAEVRAELDDDPILYVYNTGDGEALWATSMSGEAVHGSSGEGTGVGGYSLLGPALYADSLSGPALVAEGTGIIQSTAKSYVWVSGNGVRPYHQSDSTIIDMDTTGGAMVTRGASAGKKNVMLPITVPGPLYGQDVTISDLDIYWRGNTTFEAITAVLLRRQAGVGSYASIVHDTGASYGCEYTVEPEGCTIHYDTTSNNVLTANSGILYLTLELSFSSSSAWIQIGGVRLTLEHD